MPFRSSFSFPFLICKSLSENQIDRLTPTLRYVPENRLNALLKYAPSLVVGLANYFLVGFTAVLLLDNNNFHTTFQYLWKKDISHLPNISILHFSSEPPPPPPQSLTINPGSTKTSPRSLGKKISIPTTSQAQPPGRNPHPKSDSYVSKCKKRKTLPSFPLFLLSFFLQSYLPANQILHIHTRTQSLEDHMLAMGITPRGTKPQNEAQISKKAATGITVMRK